MTSMPASRRSSDDSAAAIVPIEADLGDDDLRRLHVLALRINDERIAKGSIARRRMSLTTYFAPLRSIGRWHQRIAVKVGIDLGQQQAARARHRFGKQLAAADDEYFFGVTGQR